MCQSVVTNDCKLVVERGCGVVWWGDCKAAKCVKVWLQMTANWWWRGVVVWCGGVIANDWRLL